MSPEAHGSARAALVALVIAGSLVPALVRAQDAPRIALTRGLTIVQTLHGTDYERESQITVAELAADGVRYVWSGVEVNDSGDTLQFQVPQVVGTADLAGAPRLHVYSELHWTPSAPHRFDGTLRGPGTNPGYTRWSISTDVYRQLRANGSAPISIMGAETVNNTALAGLGIVRSRDIPVRWRGTLTRVAAERFPLLMDGRRVSVPALRLRGQFVARDRKWEPEMWVLADSAYPLLLRVNNGKHVLQVVRIDWSSTSVVDLEQRLGAGDPLDGLRRVASARAQRHDRGARPQSPCRAGPRLRRNARMNTSRPHSLESYRSRAFAHSRASRDLIGSRRHHRYRRHSMNRSLRFSLPVAVVALIGVGGCGGAAADARDGEDASSTEPGAVAAAASEVPTASWPADPCGWIPVAEVESIVGPLVGPPRVEEGDCFYPLPLDAEMARRIEAARKLGEWAKEMARQQGEKYEPIGGGRPPEPGLILDVNISSWDLGERVMAMANEMMGGSAGVKPDSGAAPARRAPNDATRWDHARSPFAIGMPGFAGRIGQLGVSVRGQGTFLPQQKMVALATRVRDLIPDRPFRAPGNAQPASAAPSGPDPCGLLTRAEVEAVLGPLVVPPYRTNETSPYPYPGGRSCSYYTAGHHVLVVTPEWAGGKQTLDITRGVGGLVAAVAPDREAEAADTLEGPWDDVVANGHTAELLFLKGDRALQVAFGGSSTDAAGVIRLVGPALERLAAARPR